jgi:hypothetical protein
MPSGAAALDFGAALDDAGDRGGSTLGRLLEGISHERARCPRGLSATKATPVPSTFWTHANEEQGQQGFVQSYLPDKQFKNTSMLPFSA